VARRFDTLDDPSTHRVEVDVRRNRQNRCFIENGNASKAPFPEVTGAAIFTVGAARDRLLEFRHAPTQARHARPQDVHAAIHLQYFVDLDFGRRRIDWDATSSAPPFARAQSEISADDFMVRPARYKIRSNA
jgi:hypothetical protein